MIRFLLLAATVTGLSACGFTGKDLGPIEKRADIEWLYGVFERNYAPANWKQEIHGFSLAQAKADCLAGSESITKGDEFLAHLNRCVNRYQDAHTKLLAGGQILPEFAQVAYLGFTTELARLNLSVLDADKKKEPQYVTALKVKGFLPTTEAEGFPLAEGDFILAVDGVSIEEYLNKVLIPNNNLGHLPSSQAIVAKAFPLRNSYGQNFPKSPNITLSLVREDKKLEAVLPWTIKDLLEFTNEQRNAQAVKDEEKAAKKNLWVGAEFIDRYFNLLAQFRGSPGERVQLLLTESFRVFFYDPAVSAVMNATEEKKTLPMEDALTEETLVDVSKPGFPARLVLLKDGARVGYIRVESFSIGDEEVKSFLELVDFMNKSKVKGIVLDLLDNGGGSLVHGLRMSNALSPKVLQYPALQVALNDNWLNGFRADSIYGRSDASRTHAARVYKLLREDVAAGRRMSRPISSTELDALVLNKSKANCVTEGTCLAEGTKLVLLVNEMCASMCDIFASVFKDNKLGTILGSQTMGAGGNVVMHGVAPVSKAIVMQTESLVVDINGKYLENRGVVPDEIIDTLLDRSADFSETYLKALELAQ
jgi:C-terminal processing protease CtpA/Prc